MSSTTGVRGVYQKRQKWQVKIQYEGKKCCLGCYETKEQAGYIYDFFSFFIYKEFSVLEAGIQRVFTDDMKIKIGQLIERHQFKFLAPL